ncbi:MAG: NAD(P)-dependent oxidoreductase, partial [Dehalococcoidales bacterium]|nr:NAD(P)-dependent oxidoreductase [Dehalococcoidales bacterium]
AEKATLTIMVGGKTEVLERCRPLLLAMGQRIYHMGEVGTGAVTKLVNNMLGAINLMGVAEGMVLGTKAGIDPALLQDVISNGSGASRMLAQSVPNILKRDFAPGFMVDLMQKDVNLAVELGKGLGVRLLAGSLAIQMLQETRNLGLGRESIVAEIIPLERNAGIEVKKRSE